MKGALGHMRTPGKSGVTCCEMDRGTLPLLSIATVMPTHRVGSSSAVCSVLWPSGGLKLYL